VAAADGAFALTGDGRIALWNLAAARITGYEAHEVLRGDHRSAPVVLKIVGRISAHSLDAGNGRLCRLLWSLVSLAVLYQARVHTWQFGTPPGRVPSVLPSWLWPPAVFTAVVSALAEAFLRDLADGDNPAGAEGVSA
jgi:PAS domain-containing protein